MEKLYDVDVIRHIMKKYNAAFSKSLGQNFLINKDVCPHMASEFIGIENLGILEVGPGIGVLTNELAKAAKKVVSIEIDETLIPVLNETLKEYNNVKVINDDIMTMDLKKLLQEEFPGMTVCVCANLPYYITSPVIMKILEEQLNINCIVVMVQKEAADRLCAGAGTKNTSAISVLLRYYAEPKILFGVSRSDFMPSPKVDSCVIKLDVLKSPGIDVDRKEFLRLIKASFAMRRKTIENSLSASLGVSKEKVRELLEASSVLPGTRAQQLSLEQFKTICDNIYILD